MLSSQSSRIKTETYSFFCLHHELFKFLSIFWHSCCFAALFLIFFIIYKGFRSMSEKVWFTQCFCIFKKSNYLIRWKFCKRRHCPRVITFSSSTSQSVLLFHSSQFTFAWSLIPVPWSLFPDPCTLVPIPWSLIPDPWSLVPDTWKIWNPKYCQYH